MTFVIFAVLITAYLITGVHLWQKIVMRPISEYQYGEKTPNHEIATDLKDVLWLKKRVHLLKADVVVVWVTFLIAWPFFMAFGFMSSRLRPDH